MFDRKKWSADAFAFLTRYLRSSNVFMVEDVRRAAAQADFPMPPDNRAWGNVIVKASRQGLVQRIGYAYTTQTAESNPSVATVWKSV